MRIAKEYVQVDFVQTDHDRMQYIKTYRGTLNMESVPHDPLWISVQAEEMVECYVNGSYAGFSLWNAHEFDISGFIREGENEIVLKVTGNAANRFTEYEVAYGLL